MGSDVLNLINEFAEHEVNLPVEVYINYGIDYVEIYMLINLSEILQPQYMEFIHDKVDKVSDRTYVYGSQNELIEYMNWKHNIGSVHDFHIDSGTLEGHTNRLGVKIEYPIQQRELPFPVIKEHAATMCAFVSRILFTGKKNKPKNTLGSKYLYRLKNTNVRKDSWWLEQMNSQRHERNETLSFFIDIELISNTRQPLNRDKGDGELVVPTQR